MRERGKGRVGKKRSALSLLAWSAGTRDRHREFSGGAELIRSDKQF